MNKVMKLWTVVVTAFVALFTALGLVTTTAAAAVPQTQPARNNAVAHPEPLAMHGLWSYVRSLPPTMKQRIRAEAHGKTPSCRSRSLADTDTAAATATATEADTAPPAAADCA